MAHNLKSQRGAAAIFIVVFFAILISVIAVSFLRIAIQDQQQATTNDLSQSAYDSADAGLEDAKRALSWYNAHCPIGSTPSATDAPKCVVYNEAFDDSTDRCNLARIIRNTDTLPGSVPTGSTSEVKLITDTDSDGDEKLDQAYTCVNIKTDTENYIATAENGKNSTLIPLRTVNNQSFDTIQINWFTIEDAGTATPAYPTPKELPTNWPVTAPPVIRFQLIPVLRGNININHLDADSRTAFLYPSLTGQTQRGFGGVSPIDLGRYQQKIGAPAAALCESPISATYACSININELPRPIGGTAPNVSPSNIDYYLRLTAFYKSASYEIRLLGNNGTELRKFDNVEPEVDSTGRANDIFRRVQSRVQNTPPDNPLTDGGFDVSKGVCKDFNVPVYSTRCPPALIQPTDPSL